MITEKKRRRQDWTEGETHEDEVGEWWEREEWMGCEGREKEEGRDLDWGLRTQLSRDIRQWQAAVKRWSWQAAAVASCCCCFCFHRLWRVWLASHAHSSGFVFARCLTRHITRYHACLLTWITRNDIQKPVWSRRQIASIRTNKQNRITVAYIIQLNTIDALGTP